MIDVQIIEEEAKEKDEYPCLKIYYGNSGRYNMVVLFYGKKEGTVINKGNTGNGLGFYSKTWDEPSFKPFHGKIILQNE